MPLMELERHKYLTAMKFNNVFYESPLVEVIDVSVEQGFATSNPSDTTSYSEREETW